MKCIHSAQDRCPLIQLQQNVFGYPISISSSSSRISAAVKRFLLNALGQAAGCAQKALAGGLWENQFSFPCFTGSLGKQGFPLLSVPSPLLEKSRVNPLTRSMLYQDKISGSHVLCIAKALSLSYKEWAIGCTI